MSKVLDRRAFSVSIASGKVWSDEIEEWAIPAIGFGTALMEPNAVLKFTINYPLTTPKRVVLTHEDGRGWTEREFVEAVIAAYKEVYAAEEDPGHIPGMLNRARSEGPYGIWGHDIGDLILEGAVKTLDGEWILEVGS